MVSKRCRGGSGGESDRSEVRSARSGPAPGPDVRGLLIRGRGYSTAPRLTPAQCLAPRPAPPSLAVSQSSIDTEGRTVLGSALPNRMPRAAGLTSPMIVPIGAVDTAVVRVRVAMIHVHLFSATNPAKGEDGDMYTKYGDLPLCTFSMRMFGARMALDVLKVGKYALHPYCVCV